MAALQENWDASKFTLPVVCDECGRKFAAKCPTKCPSCGEKIKRFFYGVC